MAPRRTTIWICGRSCVPLRCCKGCDVESLRLDGVSNAAHGNGARSQSHWTRRRIGVIAPGALADLILVDMRRPHLSPQNDLIANLVYCGKASDVDTVIVDGQVVVKEHQLLMADVQTLCCEAGERVGEIKKRP